MMDEPDAHAYDEPRYEEYRERVAAWDRDEDEGYELDDPKHPTYHERMAEVSDGRE